MTRLESWAIAGVVLCALLFYNAFEFLIGGAFAMPGRYGWNLPLPDGGTIVVRGVSEVGFGAEGARFEATYRPPPSAAAAPQPDEPIGTWYSEIWDPVAYGVGAAIVFLPDASHPFVRTARGRWMPLTIEERPAAPPGTIGYFVRHVSPQTRRLIVDRLSADGLRTRLLLELSEDGEQLTLTSTQAASSP